MTFSKTKPLLFRPKTVSNLPVHRKSSVLVAIQKREKKSLTCLAREAADRGESLKLLAPKLGIKYVTLKAALLRRGYHHPSGLDLLNRSLVAESGVGLAETILRYTRQGLSCGAIARELGIDSSSVRKAAKGVEFPKTLTLRDSTRIVNAMIDRIPFRKDLRLLTWSGQTHCLTKWAELLGVSASLIRKRLKLGWPIDVALETPVHGRKRARTHYRNPSSDHPFRLAQNQEMTSRKDKEHAISQSEWEIDG